MTDRMLIRPGSTRFGWVLAGTLLLTVSLAAPAAGFAQSGETFQAGAAPVAPLAPLDAAEVTAPIADERASYSYLRTLEGSATVAAAAQGIGEPLESNQPLLTGDQVRVDSGSRLELALSDRNRLFLDADSSLILERLAFSGDREERVTVLRLESGELLLAVADEALGDELPRVITSNATVYVQEPGEYRIETGVGSDGAGWTRVVTRRGFAEVVTDRGSSVVRVEESIVALGDRSANLEISAADEPDALERWSGVLAERAARTSRSASYVEPHLAYDAAPLDEAGDWIEVEDVSYWRPYVSEGWRPYWQGRWGWTPSGYTWVSYEPWGWVPYHYGRWCSLPGYGWAWRPGALYSPAWVYWNWTSGYAGWVPMGYYSHFYDPWYSTGFRYGVYGWAGGGWGIYSDWNFAPVHCFRDRRFRGHMRRGRDMERDSGHHEPPRGLLTTDTRDFRPERLDRTDRTEDLLHQIGKRHQPKSGGDLADVTEFVGRKGKLPTEVAKVVVPPAGKERGVIRDIGKAPKVAETPTWRQKGIAGDDKAERSAGVQQPPASGAGKGARENPGATSGVRLDKGRATAPKGAPQIDSRGASATKGAIGGSGGSGGSAANVGIGGSGARAKGSATNRGGDSADKGSSAKAGAPRVAPQAPVAKTYEPTGPGRSKGSMPAGESRQLWKERGGESAPVQRVVGSVRRPSPGAETKAPGSPAAPATAGRSQEPPSYSGSKGASPRAPSTSSPSPRSAPESKATTRSPSQRSQPYEPSVKSQPQQRSQPYQPAVKSQPQQRSQPYQPSVKSQPQQRPQPYQPSVKSQPQQRLQPYQPSVKSQPQRRSQPYQPSVKSQPQQRSQPYQPAVKSQPQQRSQTYRPAQPAQGSQRSPGSQPSVRSQPSGKSSSGSQPSAKAQSSSGSKSSSRSGQSSPPPPPKKDDGRR